MKPHFTITYAMTQGLAQIERARGFLEAAQLSEKWVRHMSERALLLEAHHTTGLSSVWGALSLRHLCDTIYDIFATQLATDAVRRRA